MKNSIDYVKGIACILIIGSHCFPLFHNEIENFYYGQWFFRFCVPFFFISTGYFFSKMSPDKKKNYIKRIAILYAISTIIYLPLILQGSTVFSALYQIIYGFTHLWYLSSLFFGLLLLDGIELVFKRKKYLFILLLLPGIILDEYYKLFDSHIIELFAKSVVWIGGARNALFFALPMLLIGQYLEHNKFNYENHKFVILISAIVCFICGYFETQMLFNNISEDITLDLSFFGWTPAVPLFLLGMVLVPRLNSGKLRHLRKITDFVYIIHIYVIYFMKRFFGLDYLYLFAMVVSISIIISFILLSVSNSIRLRLECGREK